MLTLIVLSFVLHQTHGSCPTFRFANTLGSHMVLQQKPFSAKIWGFGPTGSSVTVSFNGYTTPSAKINSKCIWEVYLPPMDANSKPQTLVANIDGTASLSLTDVLVGDVYICSGQSNMQFSLNQIFNATGEINDVVNYPDIRIFSVPRQPSNTPQEELLGVVIPWSVPSPTNVNGTKPFTYFSAVCWLYGKYLYQIRKQPIGLISTNYGGTPVRSWSGPDAQAACSNGSESLQTPRFGNQFDNVEAWEYNVLWNAMIVPFLRTTIFGAIWYQGESDSDTTWGPKYGCTFPAMIRDWRAKWSMMSGTDPEFPFGFVSLSTWNDKVQSFCGDNVPCTEVAQVRWGQTANYGYVPNQKMPRTFLSAAEDLGDPGSPYGDIHPRYKQAVALRLMTAALNVAYGNPSLYSMGPYASAAWMEGKNVKINFANVDKNIWVKSLTAQGFEAFVGGHWVAAKLTSAAGSVATVSVTGTAQLIRYNWYTAPCLPTDGPYNCSIYSAAYPALPFVLPVQT